MDHSQRTGNTGISDTGFSRRSFLQWTGSAAALAAATALPAGRAYSAETGKTLRMGVVGGGFGATFHWHQHPNCKITGVTDLREDRRIRLRERYQCDAVYDSLETMIKEADDIDAVAVFSGATDHVKHTKMCFERGWHVVAACPACVTVEEAHELKELKEQTGLRYMMAESSYYRMEAIFVRNLYDSGAMGEIYYSEGDYYHDRGDLERLVTNTASRFYMPDGSRSWRWGLPPMLYPTHSLCFLTGITGERVTKVSALGWGTKDHPYLTDNAYDNPFWNESALMYTDRGHMHRCNVFWLVADHGERAQWYGDAAAVFMPSVGINNSTVKKRRTEEERPATDTVEVPQYWRDSPMLPETMRHSSGHGGSAVFLSAEFVNALLEDREPAIDVYESLAMTVPGIVAHQSALKDGEQLPVPQFD